MKIFLSYGHDRNTPLILRIKNDLEAAGHSVWIDSSKIKGADDWRRSIVDGIMHSDWTIGFLSRHSVRDPGVCLDELAIALHVKGLAIATVLLEAEAATEVPVSVSHIQWLDMRDWAERMANGSEAGENWYYTKLNQLLSVLADPKHQRFAGEIDRLDQLLRPVSQEVEIGTLVDGFIGREWLKSSLDEWRKNALESRLFWISGGPGTGKSAFAAWLAHKSKLDVIGVNFCRYNIEERRDPARMLRTLAFQIATRLADFRRFLLDRFQKEDRDGHELNERSIPSLFDWLLVEPLRFAIGGGRKRERYLVIIDALDETIRDGRSTMAEVLAESCHKLPDWLAVVVTGRPEASIVRQFAGFKPQIITAESAENLDDCRAYVRRWLAIESLGGGETETRVERIVAAAQGNFLYLKMLREAVSSQSVDLAHLDQLPRGLIGLYERWFRRQFPEPSAYERIRPLLEVLVAANNPVPEGWLRRMFGWSVPEQARTLELLGSLFERQEKGIVPFHKSIRDWLADDRSAGPDFVVDVVEGSDRLVRMLWPSFKSWVNEPLKSQLDPFLLYELWSQLSRPQSDHALRDEFIECLSGPKFVSQFLLTDTEADEDRRRVARNEYQALVERIASTWPASVEATPLAAFVDGIVKAAWQAMEGRLDSVKDLFAWLDVQSLPSSIREFKRWLQAGEFVQHPQALPHMRHLYKQLTEWELAILVLLTSIRVARAIANAQSELVWCIAVAMDSKLKRFIDQELPDAVSAILYETNGFDYLPEMYLSFLRYEAETAYREFKSNTRLADWAKEWSDSTAARK